MEKGLDNGENYLALKPMYLDEYFII